MTGATGLLIKLGVRLLVFGVVFFFAARKNPKVVIRSRWMTPLIAFVFASLNTGLYWALTSLLDLATLGAMTFVMPLIVNVLLLVGTVKVFDVLSQKVRRAPKQVEGDDKKPADVRPWFAIDGIFTTLWMAFYLTLAHGALWLALDYIPNK